MTFSSPTPGSTWSHIRTNIIFPILPYYFTLITLTAIYINPPMFAFTLLLAIVALLVLFASSVLLYRHNHPHRINNDDEEPYGPHINPDGSFTWRSSSRTGEDELGPVRSERDVKERVRRELEKLKHEERCRDCREERQREEHLKGVAWRIWKEEVERNGIDAMREQHARAVGQVQSSPPPPEQARVDVVTEAQSASASPPPSPRSSNGKKKSGRRK